MVIDPTKKAIKHFEEVKEYFTNNKLFTGNIQKDYYDIIKDKRINTNKLYYIDKGLWNCKDTLKFYKQKNENYVSQSLIQNMFGDQYDLVEVDTIKNMMINLNHSHIDLLKLDIDGAEIQVLNQMLDDQIYPTILCVEFDLYLKRKDSSKCTNKVLKRLDEYYKILKNDKYNITFIRK
jgi:FkbM family methyltransferase